MINKKNGHLKISTEIELAPFDSFENINKLKLGEIKEIRDIKNGYKWLDAKNVKIDNYYYNLSFGFLNEELKMLNFIVDDKRFELKDNWNNWTEEKERSKEQNYKKWVTNKLGRDGLFSWGQVSVEYDSKSASSSIFINYDSISKSTFSSWIKKMMTFGQK